MLCLEQISDLHRHKAAYSSSKIDIATLSDRLVVQDVKEPTKANAHSGEI
jgi:hypothetical protein